MEVPFNNLYAQYLSLKPAIDSAIARTIEASSFVRGPEVESFEKEFARLMNARYCVSCANGTDALYIAMRALGVRDGDEVIVPAHSWISTSETVSQAGGKVVFCDTRDSDSTIDTNKIESKITSRTVGIIPVHIFGHPAQMDAVMRIAKKNNLWVIEDCAQAHLATFDGKTVGEYGNIATYSFYPGKNLGAMGDAGALITNDDKLARYAACFARHGGLIKGSHEIEGINSRMDGLQAAILNVKLPHLAEWTRRRQEIAGVYLRELSGIVDLRLPQVDPRASHAWHLFVIRTSNRDSLRAYLAERSVQTVVNYPVALPFLDAYSRQNNTQRDFPTAYDHQGEVLSLPLFPDMTSKQIRYVVDSIRAFFS